jgi:hypothetical protein
MKNLVFGKKGKFSSAQTPRGENSGFSSEKLDFVLSDLSRGIFTESEVYVICEKLFNNQ